MKISVIVPVYNVENHLRKCLESICSQTYENLEIILVNDGSTDNCPLICDEYKKKDSRVEVIHKQNGGLSDARNVGLECATGDYLSFVDSDDYIAKNMLELLMNICLEERCDIAVCGVVRKYSDRELSSSSDFKQVFDNKKAFEYLIQGKYFHDYAWNKLYKSDLFKNIKYPEGKIYEDVFTTYRLFAKANKVGYIDRPLYFYVQREGSILRRGFNFNQFHQLEALEEIKTYITKNINDNYLQEILNIRILNVKCRMLFDILVNKIFDPTSKFDNNARALIKEIKTDPIQNVMNPNVNALSKIILILSVFGYNQMFNIMKTPLVKNVIMKRRGLM